MQKKYEKASAGGGQASVDAYKLNRTSLLILEINS